MTGNEDFLTASLSHGNLQYGNRMLYQALRVVRCRLMKAPTWLPQLTGDT